MPIKILKTRQADVRVRSGQTAIFVDETGKPQLKRADGTVLPMLNIDGAAIRLKTHQPAGVVGEFGIHGKEYNGVSELAATGPDGVPIRITRNGSVNVAQADFYADPQKAELTLTCPPASSDLYPTGLIVAPPSGQWCVYPCRMHMIQLDLALHPGGPVGAMMLDFGLVFDDGVGAPDTRYQSTIPPTSLPGGIVAPVVDTLILALMGAGVDSSGEVSLQIDNNDPSNIGWARLVVSIAGDAIVLPGAP